MIGVMRGIQIIDARKEECLIVADCERTIHEFMRQIRNERELTFYFDSVYYSIVGRSRDDGSHDDNYTCTGGDVQCQNKSTQSEGTDYFQEKEFLFASGWDSESGQFGNGIKNCGCLRC